VHPTYTRQGVEGLLYEYMLAHAEQHISPLTTLATDTYEDQHDRVSFLSQRNFLPVMRTLKSALQVANFDSIPYQPLISQIAARQIGIHTLVDLQAQEQHWKEKLYDLRWTLVQDVPAVEPPTQISIDEFENMIFGDPGFQPQAWFIAVDETQPTNESRMVGPFIGMSNLWVNDPSYRRLDTGLTGVIQGYRRQGLATALKVYTVEFAKQQGSQVIVASNEENNPMYQINERLGFQPIPAYVSYRKSL
jgi:GNAT superfamily N-acetyltransferase